MPRTGIDIAKRIESSRVTRTRMALTIRSCLTDLEALSTGCPKLVKPELDNEVSVLREALASVLKSSEPKDYYSFLPDD